MTTCIHSRAPRVFAPTPLVSRTRARLTSGTEATGTFNAPGQAPPAPHDHRLLEPRQLPTRTPDQDLQPFGPPSRSSPTRRRRTVRGKSVDAASDSLLSFVRLSTGASGRTVPQSPGIPVLHKAVLVF